MQLNYLSSTFLFLHISCLFLCCFRYIVRVIHLMTLPQMLNSSNYLSRRNTTKRCLCSPMMQSSFKNSFGQNLQRRWIQQKLKNADSFIAMGRFFLNGFSFGTISDGGTYRLQNSFVYYKLESKPTSNFF